jgi:hypothetical protein
MKYRVNSIKRNFKITKHYLNLSTKNKGDKTKLLACIDGIKLSEKKHRFKFG